MRLRNYLLAASVAALCAPASAGAVTLVNVDGSPATRYQAWADSSKMPTAEETVTVDPNPRCPFGRPACTRIDLPTIWIGPKQTKPVLLHELGHRFDYAMPQWKRDRFLRIMRDKRPWHSSPNSPHEQFAQAYAECARGAVGAGVKDEWGDVPEYGYGLAFTSPRQFRRVCHTIEIPN